MLHSALIAVTSESSLLLAQRAGPGEGLEAWRLLLDHFESQTRQSKVMRMIQVPGWQFEGGDVQSVLEGFDALTRRYQETTGKAVDDDSKISILIKGFGDPALKEHLALYTATDARLTPRSGASRTPWSRRGPPSSSARRRWTVRWREARRARKARAKAPRVGGASRAAKQATWP